MGGWHSAAPHGNLTEPLMPFMAGIGRKPARGQTARP